MSRTQLRAMWDGLRSSYWFLPLCMSALAVVVATFMFGFDQRIPNSTLVDTWFILHTDPGSARTALVGIAGAAVGVVGVVFSITLVPLTIASSQFGPVLLRNYLRDVGTQVVLGMYCATISYALWLLLLLPQDLTSQTTPQISLTLGLALLVACLALLVYLFNHTAVSLQASSVVGRVGDELESAIQEAYRADVPGAEHDPQALASAETGLVVERDGCAVAATASGYVRAVDIDTLVALADAHQLVLLVQRPAGAFAARGEALVRAWPAERMHAGLALAVNEAFLLGEYRTLVQDIEFGFMSLVVIASRALSPAINDPVTPLLCLDRLSVALGMIAACEQPSAYYYGADRQLRVIAAPQTFARLTDVAFNMIRQYGRDSAELLLYMLVTIVAVAPHTRTEAQRQHLVRHARLVEETAQASVPSGSDRERVRQSCQLALRAISLAEAGKATA